MLQQDDLEIRAIQSSAEKKKIVECCDEAFPRPLATRADYLEILEKIDRFADFFAAYYKGKASGYAAMYANDMESRTAYITMIGVKTIVQRQSIGSHLMDTCVKVAYSKGMKQIRLEVLNTNEKAIAFYKKHGFCVERPCTNASTYMFLSL